MAKNINVNNDNKINNINNNPLKNNNGFTLVEMIVTFLVLGILLAVSVMSLVAWQDWADFNRENEYAETLFLAAQNQLSEYSSNGTLSDFSDRAYKEAYGNKVNLNSIYYAEGKNFTAELNQENSVWVSKNAGTLCYAMSNKGDYKKYLSGEETDSPTAPIVFELLESYVYDTSILNETICIEFSLEDGQVFSALYTDKFISQNETDYAAFEYDNSNESHRGLVNIATRYESYRKDRMIGYYGVDTLSAALVSKNDKPTIAKISLNNEETLNLSFKLGKYASATNELTYNISVYDNETKKKTLDITLDTSSYPLKNYENRETVPCSVIRYSYDNEGNASSEELGKFDILAYLDKDNQVRVVLDAVDAQATTELFNKDFDSLNNAASVKAGSVKFAKTLSFHRFGIDAEKIYCSLQGYSAKYKATSVKQSNVSDIYFANETAGVEVIGSLGEVDHFNYTVKNARHLYNVRYLEDMSEENLAKYKDTENGTAYCTFALIKDIDWAEFVNGDNYYSSKAGNITLPGDMYRSGNIDIVTDRSFASYGKLRMYDKFIGNDFTVSGLKITEVFNCLSGLYGYKDLKNVEKPVGLFNRNYGLIKTTNLDNIQVTSSSDKVGAFCGVNVAGALANDEKTGILTELTVLNSGINTADASVILGKEHVGGVVGYLQGVSEEMASDGDFDEVVLSKLTNNAKVTGDKYVGGIIGEVRTSKTKAVKIIVDECTNKGAVLASNSEVDEDGIVTVKSNTVPTNAKYIGGITGYTANIYANNHDDEGVQELITIRNCVSSPVYSDSDLATLLDDSIDNAANVLSAKLNGVYVGGIVGYNYYSTIQNCTTKADKGKQGYVFGYQYVGGIVGFNQGPTSGIKGGDDSVSGVNEANVVGNEYVGGITGCNADVDSTKLADAARAKNYNPAGKDINEILESTDIIVIPDTDRNIDNRIENWVNKGIIFATGRYAGGISGYNSGWIFNCNSEVESANVDGFFQSTYSSGDYTGGIAGYNNGVIGNTKRELDSNDNFIISSDNKSEDERKISAVCYISGKNYVGGIVGYNDVDAIVEDYELAGGYILGDEEDSAFVGGYAGFNSSLRLLIDDNGKARTIISKPNEVIGEYFVGGSVGGNIINTYGVELPKDSENNPYIPTVFKTDNFLGTIYGKAFVGGFVGYNMVIDTPSLVYNNEDDFEVSYVIQQRIVDAFKTSDAGTLSDNQKLVNKVDILNNYDNNAIFENVKSSDATMYISGTDNKTTKNSLGRIEADIYIGGVFGYNDENTYVNVKDVENTTPIIADAAIEYYYEQNSRNKDYAGRDITFTYSYAGGIVGKVSRNMTIDNCSNASSGTVTTLGTYTGGLAEINEGTIINCEANSFGSSMDEYVGGICGLNKKLGVIKDCNAGKITVSGQNVVSGISAENFGTISGVEINKLTLLVSGKNIIDADNGEIVVDGTAGGVAAYNAGTIIVNDDLNIEISSKGNYAGAVAAVNDGDGIIINGKIMNSIDSTADIHAYDDNKIKINGIITGITSAGGVIGKNSSNNTGNIIAGFSNYAVITASKGTAGGIIGDNFSGNTIAFCDNHEIVTASNAGNAGGITSSNSSTITKCINYAEIKAASGMCGGISAINNEGALISYCKVEPEDKNGKLDFASKDAVGGISATNNGTIEYVNLKNINVYNYTTSNDSNIGVVTGINDEKGTVRFAASSADEKTIDNCTAKTFTNFSFVGGVAGTNKGVISGAEISEAEISSDDISDSLPKTIIDVEVGFMPNSATVASMGGVAGVNYNKISNISIVGNVIGDLGGDTVGYGGIAGVNGYLDISKAKSEGYSEYDEDSYTSVITNCSFDGEVFAEGSGAGIARIGGIAGNNGYGGDIERCYLGVRNDGDGVATDGNGGVNQSRVTKIYAGKQEDESGNLTTDIKTESRNAGVTANGKNYGVEIITEAYDKQSYAHIGGMAGTNYGRVRDCDNHEMAKSLKDKHDLDTDAVRIYAFTCVSGGIVGYSYQGSVIEGSEEKGKHISTGDNWDIKARGSDNDRGNGGIVGIYSSSNNINYVDNYADVTCIYKTNPCVGGIAGFINQREVIDLTISNATNHGDILSFQRAGGMVGLLAYSGIRFDHCINYGEVRGLNTGQDNAPAGYIQYAMHITSDIVFMSCYNHGNIVSQTNRGTGYISNVGFTGNTGASLRFIDCVNTGVIGRLAQDDKRIHYADDADNEIEPDAGNELEQSCGFAFNGGSYTNCRNYANGKIYAFSYNNINAKDCFDASGTDVASRNPTNYNVFVPFANLHNNSSAVRNNYYITKNPTESKKEYGVYASLSSGRLIRNEADNTISVPFGEPKLTNRYTYAGNQETNISFDFEYTEESQGMDSLLIYLRDNDTNTSTYRYYSYECILYDESGNELKRFDNGDELIQLSNYNNIEEGLIKIEFGEYAGKTVKRAVLHTKNTDQNGNSINESKFFGFAYVPVANKDTVSYFDVLNEYNIIKTDTCMNFKLYKDGYTFRHTDNTNATIASDNIILNDYTQFESSSDVGRWFIEPGTADVYIKAQFDIEYGPNAKGLEKLYLINDTSDGKPKSNNNQYPYYYYAVFTDEDGNVYYDGTDAEPKTITKEELTERHTYIGVEVPESCNKKVVKVEFYFKCAQARRTCINFSGFRWTEKDSDEAMLIPYDSADSYYLNFITAYKTELAKKKNGEKISLFPLFVTEEKSDDYSIVLEDNDPWNYDSEKKYYTYFDDKSPYNDLYDVAMDEGGKAWNNNTRVGVFKELDPQFEEFIYGSTYNPDVKLPITSRFWLDTYSSRGKYRVKWNAVANAVGYLTHYSLEDENGNIIYTSDDIDCYVTADSELYQDYDANSIYTKFLENGGEGNYKIHFYVKAVSAYHKLHEGEADCDKNDSDYRELAVDGYLQLPMPDFHIEFIEGNNGIVVIDNFEEFEAIPNYEDKVEIVLEGPNMFDGLNKLTIDLSEERPYSKPFVVTNMNIQSTYSIIAYAQPKTDYTAVYLKSSVYATSGGLISSAQHYRRNATNADIYWIPTNFKGFYGDTNDAISYQTELNASNIDLYTVADLVAYDEELEVPIAYGYGNVHTASKMGNATAKFTVTFSGLPSDIVGSEFEVRSYLYATQSNMMLFGHEVANDIKLTSLDDIKAITDAGYFNAGGERADYTPGGAQSIYDESTHTLKPGYVIYYDSEADNYNVYYSTSIALDEESAAEGELKGLYNVRRMTYYPHGEDENEASDGYGYYLAKDLRENRNINQTKNLGYNIANMKLVMHEPSSYSINKYYSQNGVRYAQVRFTYSWEKLYDDERFDYYFYEDLSGYSNRANVSNSTNTSWSFQWFNIPCGDTITKEEIDEYARQHATFTLWRRDQFIQPKPILETSYTVDEDSYGHSTYTFEWDRNLDDYKYEDASYSVMLVGKTINGEEVALTTPQLVNTNSIQFTDTEDNWNYNRFILTVNRTGTMDEDGRSVILPSSATGEYKCKLRLSTLSQPQIILHSETGTNGHNKFNKSGLLYDVTWGPITDANELKDLGGYLITVSVKNGSSVKPHYYYIQDIENADAADDVIGLDIEKLTENGAKVIDLSNDRNSSYDESYNSRGQHRAIIDLSDFAGGDELSVTVKAIARKESENYMDGKDSTPIEMTLPERLKTPDITHMTATLPNDASSDSIFTISDINDTGITLNFVNPDFTDRDSGIYNIAIAIYDEKGDDEISVGSKQVEYSGDIVSDSDMGYWNSGSVYTYAGKSDDAKMEGTKLNEASYQIKQSGSFRLSDYAGKYMKIAIKATTNSDIDSWWTDEDPDDDATVNYYWVKIPKIKLDGVSISGTTETGYKYYYDNISGANEWIIKDVSDTTAHLAITHETLSFKTQDYADGYVAKISGLDNQIQYIYIVPNGDDTFEVYGFYADGASVGTEYIENVNELSNFKDANCEFNPYVIKYGTLSEADEVAVLTYNYTLKKEIIHGLQDDQSVEDLMLTARLNYSGDGKISIILPDIRKIGKDTLTISDVSESDYNITERVTVQAIVGIDGESGYEASDIEKIIRNSNADKEWNIERSIIQGEAKDVSDLIEIDGDIAIDGSLNQTVGDTTKEYYKLKFKTKTTNPVIYRILVINNSNELVCEKYATVSSPIYDNGTLIGYESYAALLKDYLDENGTYSVIISAADVDNTCISAWSNSIYLTKTGFGSDISDEEMILDERILGSSPDYETLGNILNINVIYQAAPADSSDEELDNINEESGSETEKINNNQNTGQSITSTEEALTEEMSDTTTEETSTVNETEEISTEEITVE